MIEIVDLHCSEIKQLPDSILLSLVEQQSALRALFGGKVIDTGADDEPGNN